MACRPSINRSTISTPATSSASRKPSAARPIPTTSSCACRASGPPQTPLAKRWNAPWPNTSSSASAKIGRTAASLPYQSLRDCVADSYRGPRDAPHLRVLGWYAGRAMRSQPRKSKSEAELYAAALRALTRRAHSSFELRIYLERRALEPELVRRVLARLKQEKL